MEAWTTTCRQVPGFSLTHTHFLSEDSARVRGKTRDIALVSGVQEGPGGQAEEHVTGAEAEGFKLLQRRYGCGGQNR